MPHHALLWKTSGTGMQRSTSRASATLLQERGTLDA
jgi:hypothetical protein